MDLQKIIAKSLGWSKSDGRDAKRAIYPLQIKNVKETSNGDVTFTGDASVFDILDSDRDIIAPEAFTETLQRWEERGRTPPMLWQHDWHEPVGKWDVVKETERALEVEGRLFAKDISRARQAGRLIQEKALDGLSIGFFIDGPVTIDDEARITTLHKLDLWEISIVTFPALDVARINGVKSGEIPELNTLAEAERYLRSIGLSRKAATALCSQVKRLSDSNLDERDEATQGELAKISKQLDTFLNVIRG